MKRFPSCQWRAATAGLVLISSALSMPTQAARSDYREAVKQLEQAVLEEMQDKGISGITLAMIDDQEVVHAAGLGVARKDSIFRCGSISKLFNAVAVMQLVEAGRLDLDAPIQDYDPRFSVVVPFEYAPPITLRQLLCHRSGMIRESPVGGYLDDSEPNLEETITSVRSCVLVNPPNTETRYSNVGPSIAGQIVCRLAGMSYDRYQQKHLLGPLKMQSSSFLLQGIQRRKVVESYMRVADGRGGFNRRKAPLFDLGTVPAGNLYSTAEDLGRFVCTLAAEGRAGSREILSASSLAEMFTPQLTGAETGFGLGFAIGTFRGHKSVQHLGAVYGYTSSLVFLPGPKIGMVVLCNEDVVPGPVRKLTERGLSLMLEVKLGEAPPAVPDPIVLPAAALADFSGDYESESYWAHLAVRGDRLEANISGQPLNMTPIGPMKFLADGRLENNRPLEFERDAQGQITGFTMGQKFQRVRANQPASIPDAWRRYLGSYGPSFIPLVISVRHGHLYAMTENMADYRLRPLNGQVFAMPPGLYTDEHLVILTNPRGKPHAVNLANMILKRR